MNIDRFDKRHENINIVGLGWERADPSRILQSFIREHYRVHYITGGSGWLKTKEQTYQLTEGSGFIIFPGEPSSYYPDKDNPWEYFWMGVKGDSISEYLKYSSFTRKDPIFKITNSKLDTREILVNLYISIINPTVLTFSTAYYLYDFFNNIEAYNEGRRSKFYFIENGLKYIHENYTKDINVGTLANHLSIDRTYLYKLFVSEMNISPQAYIINYKIAKACELLLSTEDSITQIAYKVGFNNNSDFYKQFKKRIKISPGKFREVSENKMGVSDGIYY